MSSPFREDAFVSEQENYVQSLALSRVTHRTNSTRQSRQADRSETDSVAWPNSTRSERFTEPEDVCWNGRVAEVPGDLHLPWTRCSGLARNARKGTRPRERERERASVIIFARWQSGQAH